MGFLKVAFRPLGLLVVRDGRTSRGEFWSYVLVVWLAALLSALALSLSGRILDFYAIGMLLWYVLLFAVLVRRLHDTGRRGWSLLITLIPLLGLLELLYWLASPGDDGDNAFGPPPSR
jgi:uncharacterized membrane protein YhaH (DUF805 family)